MEGVMIIVTQSPAHAFNLRQALWALGYVPRAVNGSEIVAPEGVSIAALVSTLSRGGFDLCWIGDDRAELVKMHDRRKEVA